MPYLCSYKYCEHDEKVIPEGRTIGCSKCEKNFHSDCFEKHNREKHSGKAIAKNVKEVKIPHRSGCKKGTFMRSRSLLREKVAHCDLLI